MKFILPPDAAVFWGTTILSLFALLF